MWKETKVWVENITVLLLLIFLATLYWSCKLIGALLKKVFKHV